MSQRLTLFDLDNTLLAGDSDHAWGEFLISQGLVDELQHRSANDAFYQQYLDGILDIHAYVKFTLGPVLEYNAEERKNLQHKFMEQVVQTMILDRGRKLIMQHKQAGDRCVLITATNAFITAPIAKELGFNTLLATDLKQKNDRLTGEIAGIPCYQYGKLDKLEQWLQNVNSAFNLKTACFYSDSINDMPLLRAVGNPVAVDPDKSLANHARNSNWPIISLR